MSQRGARPTVWGSAVREDRNRADLVSAWETMEDSQTPMSTVDARE